MGLISPHFTEKEAVAQRGGVVGSQGMKPGSVLSASSLQA